MTQKTSQTSTTRRAVALPAAVACAGLVTAVGLLVWLGPGRPFGVAVGASIAIAGLALVRLAHAVEPDTTDEERRVQKGPHHARRTLLIRLGVGAAALTAAGVAVPASRRIELAVEHLKATRWTRGSRVVDSDGELVVFADVAGGEMITVYPEGWVGEIDSQAVLIREPEERFSDDDRHGEWLVGGVVIYSKLCTHMACSLGLYQQQSGTLLCPCHQAAFDVLDRGRAVRGPARRPLPRLGFDVDGDGHLVALGDFSDTVGSGFWWRP